MKIAWIVLLLGCGLTVMAQRAERPVITARANVADYRIGQTWSRGNWRIMPEIPLDPIPVLVPTGGREVAFYTDSDSIAFHLLPGDTAEFFVQLQESDALALTAFQSITVPTLTFTMTADGFPISYRQDRPSRSYLRQLRRQYALDQVVAGARTDTEKACRILNWVHSRWQHDGENMPSQPDALTILAAAAAGQRFRCVEYSIVLTAALKAAGLPARTLGLKVKDVETIEAGAGHVATEVYLPDLRKWALVDGQFNAMPQLRGVPLNAVELQHAIRTDYAALELPGTAEAEKDAYYSWIVPYLYYFDIAFEQRQSPGDNPRVHDGKQLLMLLPAGAKQPTVFQRRWPLDVCQYTHSLASFYAKP